jgi:hypothetical protein
LKATSEEAPDHPRSNIIMHPYGPVHTNRPNPAQYPPSSQPVSPGQRVTPNGAPPIRPTTPRAPFPLDGGPTK